jgi:hypothetical protein
MTILLFTAAALVILALLLSTVRSLRQIGKSDSGGNFHNVDVAAFRTLMRIEDDQYLRAHLEPAAFRRVRRARTLAVQQYLSWIAADCETLLQLIQRRAPNQGEHLESQVLMRQAIRLRFTALALRAFLWLQYGLPGLDAMPHAVARKYETLRERVDSRFGSEGLAEALSTH